MITDDGPIRLTNGDFYRRFIICHFQPEGVRNSPGWVGPGERTEEWIRRHGRERNGTPLQTITSFSFGNSLNLYVHEGDGGQTAFAFKLEFC